jgi:hypothetical protein
MALTIFHKEIRKSQVVSWRDYCQEIEDALDRAHLMRIMANQSANRVGSIKLPDG